MSMRIVLNKLFTNPLQELHISTIQKAFHFELEDIRLLLGISIKDFDELLQGNNVYYGRAYSENYIALVLCAVACFEDFSLRKQFHEYTLRHLVSSDTIIKFHQRMIHLNEVVTAIIEPTLKKGMTEREVFQLFTKELAEILRVTFTN